MKVLGIGNPFLDRTVRVDQVPAGLVEGGTLIDEREKVDALWQQIHGKGPFDWSLGGSSTNVIKALALLNPDVSCGLLGMVGKDKKEMVESKLQEARVKSLLVESANDNGFVNCFVTPDGQRTMQAFLGASVDLSPEKILEEPFEDVSHVHLEGYLAYFGDVLKHSTELAEKKGAKVSLDLSNVDVTKQSFLRERLKECAAKVHMIFGNLEAMQSFTGCEDIEDIFKKFKATQIVVITNGSKGGWVKAGDSDEIISFEALPVANVSNTTGAGDFFIAGFLAGLHKGIPLSIEIAKLAASYVIQEEGARLPKEKWDELRGKVSQLMI